MRGVVVDCQVLFLVVVVLAHSNSTVYAAAVASYAKVPVVEMKGM